MTLSCTAPRQGHHPGSAAERACPVHGAKSAQTVAAPVVAQPSVSQWEVVRRPDGSVMCEVIRRADGSVMREWWRNESGDLHRLDGPAVIEPDANGVVAYEEWLVGGIIHRLGGPAVIKRDHRGVVTRELWYVDGKCHRLDGPARVERDPRGVVTIEWWVDGGPHRVDGPAAIRYFADGTVDHESFYLRGDEASVHEVLAEFLGERASGLSEAGLRELAESASWRQWGEITDDQIAVMRLLYPNFGDGSMATVQS